MNFSPKQAMKLALQEARKGIGWVEPNPPVGCVILDSNSHFLSSGYHEKYGQAHAEVNALKKIKDKKKLKGAHIFITLEPCHHTGKTPSCAQALAHYPIKSLTYGVNDPFTKKGGLDYLSQKGVKIICSPDFQKELEHLVAPFKFSFLNKKSFVSLKVASSLDGVVALENEKSQWITGEKAREHSHFLRASHSAILIGVNTFLKDKPRLNIRIAPFKNKKNKVIILDPAGKSFSSLSRSPILKTHSPDQIIVCCEDKIRENTLGIKQLSIPFLSSSFNFKSQKGSEDSQLDRSGQEFVSSLASFPFGEKKSGPESQLDTDHPGQMDMINKRNPFSLSHLLKALYQEERIQSVLVEGGAFCWSEFLSQQVAQKLYLYIAPKIIGKGLRWSKNFTIQKLSDSSLLNSMSFQPIGEDFLLEGFFN